TGSGRRRPPMTVPAPLEEPGGRNSGAFNFWTQRFPRVERAMALGGAGRPMVGEEHGEESHVEAEVDPAVHRGPGRGPREIPLLSRNRSRVSAALGRHGRAAPQGAR